MSAATYRPDRAQGPWDALIIGSGIGGLSLAAILARQGKRVLILERHYVAGGFTHTFKRKQWEWDVGVHYIGEVGRKNSILRKVFDYISDSQLQWAPMDDVYDRAIFGDESYDFIAGIDRWKAYLYERFPREQPAIDTYLGLVREVARSAQMYFMGKALPPLLGNLASPVLSRRFLKLSDRTVHEVISSLTQDPKLIGLLCTQFGDYGLPPKKASFAIHAMIAKHYWDGGYYPVGGSASFVNTIAPVIEKGDGKILVKADVSEILVRDRKAIGVRLASGDDILAPLVISDAGVINTYGRLIPSTLQNELGISRLLKKVTPSLAHVCLYLGFNKTAAELDFPKTNYWIFPNYDHDANMERFEQDPSSPFPVTYLSFPSAKDPSWDEHHPGTATLEAITGVPYSWFRKWEEKPWQKRGADYEANKQQFAERFLTEIYQRFPTAKAALAHSELSTPLSTRHFCNYPSGEIYGIDHTPERFRQKWLRPATPVKNLYLTGQDIVTDGIGGALMGGVLTASVLLRKNVLGSILKQ